MKRFIACLLLGSLFGIIPLPIPAQQDQSLQYSVQEIDALKKRVAVLEEQLHIVENVEKMELQAKLAEANTKLANVEFSKFKRELRDANNGWLIKWGILALAIIAAAGAGWGGWLRSEVSRFSEKEVREKVENEVEKNLNGFKDGLKDLHILKTQLGVLEKEHTVSILTDFLRWSLQDEHNHPEPIKALREEALLDVLKDGRYDDEKLDLELKYKAAEILAARKSPRLVSPVLELLNSVIESDTDIDFETGRSLRGFVNCLAYIHTQETFQGLTKFLNRLLTENSKQKQHFFTETAFALAMVSLKLSIGDSVSLLRMAIPQLEVGQDESQALKNLTWYFDRFDDPIGIKKILNKDVTRGMPEVESKCLELLEKHDPEFVEKWRAEHTTDNEES